MTPHPACDVSVVIPAYRASNTIAHTVRSALAESVVAEIVVVIDGPDAALQSAVPVDPRVRLVVLEQNRGASPARNIGLALAKAEYVLFLDADDFVEGGLIAALAEAARNADLAFGPYAFGFASGSRIPVDPHRTIGQPTIVNVLKAWFRGDYVPCCSVLWRTAFVRALGGYDETILNNHDGELVWRACNLGPRLALTTTGCGVYMQSMSPHRASANRSRAMFEQQLTLFARTADALPNELLTQVSAELGGMYYRLARAAYYSGAIGAGRQAEQAARRLGAARHRGTPRHRMASALLGLERKERLSSWLHRARRVLRRSPASMDVAAVRR